MRWLKTATVALGAVMALATTAPAQHGAREEVARP